LESLANLPSAASAVLSLAWRLVTTRNGKMETVLFDRVADGTIRRYDVHLKAPSTNNNNNNDDDDDDDKSRR
jgi:hypothetical protein